MEGSTLAFMDTLLSPFQGSMGRVAMTRGVAPGYLMAPLRGFQGHDGEPGFQGHDGAPGFQGHDGARVRSSLPAAC